MSDKSYFKEQTFYNIFIEMTVECKSQGLNAYACLSDRLQPKCVGYTLKSQKIGGLKIK